MNKFVTLDVALKENAKVGNGLRILNGSKEERYISYADLLKEASRCLSSYQVFGVKKGDELILQFKNLHSFVVGYWACLLGGIVPVTLPYADNQANMTKLFNVWDILKHPWVATDCDELLNKLELFSTSQKHETLFHSLSSRIFNPEQINITSVEPKFEEANPEDIALIQFSSGTTDLPKGVILTHQNLLANIYDFVQYLEVEDTDSFLSWLPLTHDMGMICFHLAPIVLGVNQNIIPTNIFIWNPTYWFSSVNKYQANILGSPNFGYRHFLKRFKRKIAQREKWDINCVKVMLNGAEPISRHVCEDFKQELKEWGLADTAMLPGYGLAEATLVVSITAIGRGVFPYTVDRKQLSIEQEVKFLESDHPDAIEVIDCGNMMKQTELRITDRHRKPLGEGFVGNIEVRGPSITSGYYQNSEATDKVLSLDGWLNTQDLGFIHQGRLVFVGREKEMIIIGGVNYFPYDIENVILQNLGMENLNKYVASGNPNPDTGTEDLIIFVYYKKKKMDDFIHIAETIRQVVLTQIGLRVTHVLPVKHIPKTSSGKIQRYKLIQAYRDGKFEEVIEQLEYVKSIDASNKTQTNDENGTNLINETLVIKDDFLPKNISSSPTHVEDVTKRYTTPEDSLLKSIKVEVENLLGITNVNVNTGFFDLGLNSSQLLLLQKRLEKRLGIQLSSMDILDYSSIHGLAEALQKKSRIDVDKNKRDSTISQGVSGDIAIVGVACRFPGDVKSPEDFWQLLESGIDPVRPIPEGRWNDDNKYSNLTTTMGGYLENIEKFDPLFFNITPTEAEVLDPQQRLLLELTWEAFEDAGWNPKSLSGSQTGVFIGIAGSDYLQVGRDLGQHLGPYTYTGNMLNSAAGRISYTFGLQGPCMAIDTACSSSLVAVHQGVLQLRSGSCDVVLSGAVNLILRSEAHASFSNLQALSASGRCRSFDESADGYIRSEGSAVLILKRLEDAQRDGDNIWGVIRGAAVNHNGKSSGLTVPNGLAQQQVIQKALVNARLEPEDVDYVETHGSATKIGDPQEANALTSVFSSRKRPLYIGSVKSNLGHLETAAGMAGLCKVLLSMRNGKIPANLHFKKRNPLINWENTPLEVVNKNTEWKLNDGVRRAGISSFSISGTNAHIILEWSPEYSSKSFSKDKRKTHHLCTLSARTEGSLREYVRQLEEWCQHPTSGIEELIHTLNRSRASLNQRLSIIVKDMDDFREQLSTLKDSTRPLGKVVSDERIPLVFLFTGQGSHYHRMAKELYDQSPQFKKKMRQLDEMFLPEIGASIIKLLYGDETEDIQCPLYMQPLIFSTQIALVHFWESLGVVPDLIIGHSIGEYAAACIDGVMSLQDAVLMVSSRARVMENTPVKGRMVGLLTNEDHAKELIAHYDDVSIAAINAPRNVTISGGKESIEDIVNMARKSRIFVEELDISHPVHSVLIHDLAVKFKSEIANIQLNPTTARFISTVTGDFVSNGSVLNADYWAEHLIKPVLFSSALNTAVQAGGRLFIEVGGTATLSGLAAQNLNNENCLFLPSLRKGLPSWKQIYETIGRLWEEGCNVNLGTLYTDRLTRIEGLPHTPYHRSTFWYKRNDVKKQSFDDVTVTTLSPSTPIVSSTKRYLNIHSNSHSVMRTKKENDGGGVIIVSNNDQKEIRESVRIMIGQVTGVPLDDITDSLNLFTLGLDSLMLVQLGKNIMGKFGVDIPMNVFFSELNTLYQLTQYIEENRPVDLLTTTSPERKEIVEEIIVQPKVTASTSNGIQEIFTRQLDIMEEQLRLMRGEVPTELQPMKPLAVQKKKKLFKANNNVVGIPSPVVEMTSLQKEFLERFISRWTSRTKKSKEYAAQHRDSLADWIVSLNFDLRIKELVYPIVSKNSEGSRFWDIDGNMYIDTAMGYGVSFFGHKPKFITEAIQQQLDKGFELGPQSSLVGEVTELIKDITGVERVAYCNTGTEAVMVALRLARSVTGRDKIVRFTTSFHGSFDGVLAEADGDRSQPMASGIPQTMVDDTIVLSYCSKESIEIIKRYKSELAAILVEPVQSRNLGLQPREYLQQLRTLCTEYGIALIFDEMITGFRIHTGGAQAYFGVEADIVTYGKLVGGGMPIGIVAGKSEYLDAVDGGTWSYGDDSIPTAETTFFAGTFCKHPLTMAACLAVLRRIQKEGPALIEANNDRTSRFVDRANAYFLEAGVPLKTLQFGSMYRFEAGVSTDMSILPLELNLFFRLMMEHGIYVWERRTCFFSVKHTEEDANRILDALRDSVDALREGGFEFHVIDGRNDGPNRGRAVSFKQFELSTEERRVYIMSNLEGGNEAYQIRGKLDFNGTVDFEKLKKAFGKITERYEMLRCSIHVKESKVVHLIEDSNDMEYLYVDIREENGQEEFETFFERPFNLKQAPLWRWVLVVGERGQHTLYISLHHIISDGGTMNIILQELSELYKGKYILEHPSLSYKDFVKKEQDFRNSSKAKEQREWWKKQLLPVPPPLNLPQDALRPPINKFKGEIQYFTIDTDVLNRVRSLAKENKSTTFMVLLAAWTAFIGRIAERTDFCIGVPWDKRNSGDFNRTVGMFAQTLVLRLKPENSLSFRDYIATVKETCLGSYQYADYPFNDLLTELDISRDLSRNPLFDVMFNYEKDEQREIELGDVQANISEVPLHHAQFDLTLEIFERKDRLHCSVNYAVPLYSKARVQDWIRRFQSFLLDTLVNPTRLIGEVELISEKEKQELLRIGQGPHMNLEGITASEILSQAIQECSEQPAVWSKGEEITFATLDKRASLMAKLLSENGLKAGDKIGILLPRTPDLIATMLAAMKIGCAWVPLDPTLPEERLRYMIESSELKLLVCKKEIVEQYPYEIPSVDPNDGKELEPLEQAYESQPDDLAYVIYTSGSTGKPKGVQVEQSSLANFLIGMAQALDWPKGGRTACMTTPSFDIFILETLLCLSQGGCVVLAEEELRDPASIVKLICEGKVDCLQMTPTRLQLLCVDQKDADEVLNKIKVLIVGGEEFPTNLLPMLQEYKTLKIFNVYGPTETCIWSTYKELTDSQTVSIGLPILNTSVYVLDKHMRLVPPRVAGDLWIGGAGVSCGYIGNEKLTNERFVDNPFVEGKMYCTGDKVKWNKGELECLGREDNQVKIRGYRIELGEIEAVLRRHPSIINAVVDRREISPGNHVLVSYYQLRPNHSATNTELKTWLADRLPDYMVSNIFVKLSEIPQTQNGKIDRKSLPKTTINTISHTKKESYGHLELTLIDVWKKVLGDRHIGIHDRFFDIGGNSFGIVLMQAELDKVFPGIVTVADLFALPSIARLKEFIETKHAEMFNKSKGLLPLKESWYDNTQKKDGQIEIMVHPRILSNLEEFGVSYGLELNETICTLFALYLHKSLEQDHIPLWMIHDRENVSLMDFDFKEDLDLGKIFSDFTNIKPTHDDFVHLDMLSPTVNNDKNARVGFSYNRTSNRQKLLRKIDIYLNVTTRNERVYLTLEYGRYLNTSILRKQLNRFIKLLEQVVERLQNA